MNDNNHEQNDLTVIKGIGKTRAQWLRSSLDIQTLRDLSTMSAEAIETRLKAEGFITSRAKIESWIEQARQILAETAQENMPKKPDSSRQSVTDQSLTPSAWKSMASFVVEYQMRNLPDGTEEKRSTVHHIESDQEMSWSNTATAPLIEWIQAYVDETGEQSSAPVQATAATANKANVPTRPGEEIIAPLPIISESGSSNQLEITQIQAFQPAQTMQYAGGSRIGQPFLGSLKSEETFALEASFELADEIAEKVATSKAEFSVQFYAYDTQSGAITHLGNTATSQLKADQETQKAVLPGARLKKGLYRLRVYSTLHSETPETGYLEVPYVQVT